MQELSKETSAPLLKEHDYIGQSSSLTSSRKNSYPAECSQLGLEETNLRLELGLGLGLGSGFTKKQAEAEAKCSLPLKPVAALPERTPLGLSDVTKGVVFSAPKNGTKRGYSETKVSLAAPGRGNVEGDASIRRQPSQQGAFLPIWAPSKPTVSVWQNEKPAPSNVVAGRFEPHVSSERKQDLVPDEAPPAKDQVVGWPPVRSYRRQTLAKPPEMYVKVNMDGVTVGRKVDLNAYTSYESLLLALEDMFQTSNTVQGPSCARDHDLKHFLLLKGPDFLLTYEDKEGDWMLVGDVPWSMFVSTVRRLRITRGADATGSGGCEKLRCHA